MPAYSPPQKTLRKIATGEAFTIPEISDAYRLWVRKEGTKPRPACIKTTTPHKLWQQLPTMTRLTEIKQLLVCSSELLDVDEFRLADMDANNVFMYLLFLTMPGDRVSEAAQAIELAAVGRKITIQYRTVVFKSLRVKCPISYLEIGTSSEINSGEHEKAPFEFVHDGPDHCGYAFQR